MNDGFPRTDKILWKGKIDASRQRQTQAKTVTRACIRTQKTLQGACTSRANPTPGPSVSPVMGPRGGS